MATKEKRKVKKKKKPRKQAVEFSLQDVLAVGGDKDDYDMLKDVNDDDDLTTDVVVKGRTSELKKDEIMSMIQGLGLDKLVPETEGNGNLENEVEQEESIDEGEEENNPGPMKLKEHEKKNSKSKEDANNNSEKQKPNSSIDNKEDKEITALHKKLLIKPGGKWYDQIPEDEKCLSSPSTSAIDKLQREAQQIWQHDANIYDKMKSSKESSQGNWLRTVVTSGTLGDKIAALTLQVQESPVHQVKALDILVAMAKKKGRRESVMAIDTLKELWLEDLLPEDRKLKTFSQPLGLLEKTKKSKMSTEARQIRLILWHFESVLKQKYSDFVSVFEHHLQDTIANIRSKILGIVFDLLCQRPEQEQLLLKLLVNKVGDPDRNVASKASYLLRSLVTKHPNMKMVVVKEVEHLLFRPNIANKAQYYAVCFLNQIILNKNEDELASKLIAIYFSFFKAFVKKEEVETKMLSALLTGVNRAFPFTKDNEEDKYSEQLNMLFKIVHIGTFNTSLQALMLLLQVLDSRQSISDRYYTALYGKLLDTSLATSSKQAMFLNMLYKSLKIDTSIARVKAFVKRLLQICTNQQPAFICGALYLISELMKIKPAIKSMIEQPEEEDEEEHFEDASDDDDDDDIDDNDKVNQDMSSDKDEGIVDEDTTKDDSTEHSAPPSMASKPAKKGYDHKSRNPVYSGAENTCMWEIAELCEHYHPSVSHFANIIRQSQVIEYKGDPLQDFTLMRFLDRFIYKNPKKKLKDHGGSLMQPKTSSVRLQEDPVNSNAFLNKKEEDVREDELFFYKYFKAKAADKGKKKKEQDNESSDEDLDVVQDENASLQFDFAREVKKSKQTAKKDKRKNDDDDDDDEDDDDDNDEDAEGKSSDEEEFDYENMDFSDEENLEDVNDLQSSGKKRKFTDQDYEKALLENISSDEFDSDEEGNDKKGRSKKKQKLQRSEDISSLFASADEFAHLLEDSASAGGGSHDVSQGKASNKQILWEQRANQTWSHKRGQGRGRGGRENRQYKGSFLRKGKQGSNKGMGFRGRGVQGKGG